MPLADRPNEVKPRSTVCSCGAELDGDGWPVGGELVCQMCWEAYSADLRPSWWPENPYPADVFTMTLDDYVKAVPDERVRTAISGCLGRLFWDIASDAIFAALVDSQKMHALLGEYIGSDHTEADGSVFELSFKK